MANRQAPAIATSSGLPGTQRPAPGKQGWWLILFVAGAPLLLVCSDGRTRALLGNTFLLSSLVAAISLPAGTLLAWIISRTDAPLRRLTLRVCIGLLFVPLFLQTAAWDAGFGLQGWFHVGGRLAAEPLLAGWRGAVWVHALAAIPWVVLIVSVGLRHIPAAWEDAALLDARPARVMWHIVLPQLTNALCVAVLWVFVTTAGEITVTDIFGVRTYAEEIYIGFARGAAEETVANGYPRTWVGSLLIAWLTCGAVAVLDGLATSDQPSSATAPRRYRLGPRRWWWGVALAAILLLLVAIPLANLIYKLGIVVLQIGDERQRHWSLWKAGQLLLAAPFSFREELGWTLAIAQLAAAAALGVAVPAAWWAIRSRMGRICVSALVGLTLAIPGPLLGIGIIQVLNQPDVRWLRFLYDQSITAPWLALCIRGWPIATLILWQAFRTVARPLLESARLEGAGVARQLLWVVLPSRGAAIVGAWFVTLAVAAGELTASILVVPPGVTTISIRMFGLVHYGVEDRLAALCLWAIAAFATVGMTSMWLLRPWSGEETLWE